jgi:hypothetical protein
MTGNQASEMAMATELFQEVQGNLLSYLKYYRPRLTPVFSGDAVHTEEVGVPAVESHGGFCPFGSLS